MSEIKVRAVDFGEPKGAVELEEELIRKAEKDVQGPPIEEKPRVEVEQPNEDLTDEKVLSYIGKRYNKQINSFDELLSDKKESEELPEDVSAYLKFKKETGRGFEDFIKVNKDFDKVDPDQLLREYLSETQTELDESDIDILMEQYSYDEEIDDEADVKKAKIARKKAIAEAKNYFNSQKEKYKLPLESKGNFLNNEEKSEFEAYREYIKKAKGDEDLAASKRSWYEQKTEEVFSKDFKGFEFEVEPGKKLLFSPGSPDELKKAHLNPSGFVSKFLNKDGLLEDSAGYHKSLAIAFNPEKFASFFYEQGKSLATDELLKEQKNIQMSERKVPEQVNKGGFQVRAVNPDSGRNLKIRSIKKL